MLASKFYVFATNRNFYNVSKLPLSIHHVKLLGRTLRCDQRNKSDSNIIKYQSNPYDLCKQNAEILARYPKKNCAEIAREKQPPEFKWEAITIISEYEEARSRVRDKIEAVSKFVNEEKEAITESLKKETNSDKNGACRWLKDISNGVDEKLQQLIQLDPCFGSRIRITVLRYKDRAKNTFFALQYELTPSLEQIESKLIEIETETAQCLQQASGLTLFCNCEGSPSVFKKRFFDNMVEAEKILERAKHEARMNFYKVKKLRNYILKCHCEALNEETKTHASEMQVLSRYLTECLNALQNREK